MAERKYLSCAETAKLVRQALKESFPGVKFSVRSDSYSGGASIDVRWEDGPTGKQVDEILGAFEGAYFDGMIDYKGSRYHKLDGQPVHFGANFIHGSRRRLSLWQTQKTGIMTCRNGLISGWSPKISRYWEVLWTHQEKSQRGFVPP